MTIGGWILFGILGGLVMMLAAFIAFEVDGAAKALSILVGVIVTVGIFLGIRWYYTSTEAGQRAIKTQQSNLDGGLCRTVTVYGYSGEEIRSWTGKFDVTENDQETWFDIDGRRVIIQGGIVINEEQQEG